MELQGGYFRVLSGYFWLFWGYFGPLGANQTTLSYSLPMVIMALKKMEDVLHILICFRVREHTRRGLIKLGLMSRSQGSLTQQLQKHINRSF